MANPLLMDRIFQRIMRGLVETGRAPHYAELAGALGLPVEEGRRRLHDVMQAYPIGWLDYLSTWYRSEPPSAAPISSGSTSAARSGWGPRTLTALMVKPPDTPSQA